MINRFILFVLLVAGLVGFSAQESLAQLSIDGDFRFRPEYRHGFQTLPSEGQDPVFQTSQRSRINLGFRDDRYSVRFSIQDVRIWGSQSQTSISDGQLSVHEAWIEYRFNKKLALKGGRMELAYDNHRILGNLDWAQQGRKHDVALLKFTDSTWALHAGFAYNQDKDQLNTNLYTVANSYKAMQFVWMNKQFSKVNFSFLFLNNGTQYAVTNENNVVVDHSVKWSQTTGLNVDFKSGRFFLNSFAYAQTGRDSKNREVRAFDANLEAGIKATSGLTLSVGAEYLSGTSNASTTGVNRSFTPLYGTNHIFNGYMDYFYVGNHVNNVGLQDVYFRVKQPVGKGTLGLDIHHFSSAASIVEMDTSAKLESYLGTEFDLTYRIPVTSQFTLQAGYSHMLASNSMEYLKKGSNEATSNWAYLWIIFKPDFLSKKAAK